jgi:hypothetical protein
MEYQIKSNQSYYLRHTFGEDCTPKMPRSPIPAIRADTSQIASQESKASNTSKHLNKLKPTTSQANRTHPDALIGKSPGYNQTFPLWKSRSSPFDLPMCPEKIDTNLFGPVESRGKRSSVGNETRRRVLDELRTAGGRQFRDHRPISSQGATEQLSETSVRRLVVTLVLSSVPLPPCCPLHAQTAYRCGLAAHCPQK